MTQKTGTPLLPVQDFVSENFSVKPSAYSLKLISLQGTHFILRLSRTFVRMVFSLIKPVSVFYEDSIVDSCYVILSSCSENYLRLRNFVYFCV